MTRRAVVLAALVLGLATVGAGAGTWVTGVVTGVAGPEPIAVAGTTAAPVVTAAGLVTAAAGLALSLGGRVTRVLVAAVLAGAGVLVAVSAIAVARDPWPAARSAALETVGVAVAAEVAVAPLAWVAMGLGVAAVGLAGAAALGRWSGTSRRYEGPDGRDRGETDVLDTWDALTRGEDPTAH